MDKKRIKVRIETIKSFLNNDQRIKYLESEKKTRNMDDITGVEIRAKEVVPLLDDEQKPLYYAAEAEAWGYGGKKFVAGIAGVHINTVTTWSKKLISSRKVEGAVTDYKRKCINKGGRPIARNKIEALFELIYKETGNKSPKPLIGISKSSREIRELLKEKGITISPTSILNILKNDEYSLYKINDKNSLRAMYYTMNNMDKIYSKINEHILQNNKKKLSLLLDYSGGINKYSPMTSGLISKKDDYYLIGVNAGYTDYYSEHPLRINDKSNFLIKWWKEKGKKQFPDVEDIYLVIIQDDLFIVDTLLKRTCEEIHKRYGLKGSLTYDWILRPKMYKWNCTLKNLYSVTHERPHDEITISLNQIVIS